MALTLAAKTRSVRWLPIVRKAEDIVGLNVQPCRRVADHFLICSGASDRQVHAIAEAIEEELTQHGEKPLAHGGLPEGYLGPD